MEKKKYFKKALQSKHCMRRIILCRDEEFTMTIKVQQIVMQELHSQQPFDPDLMQCSHFPKLKSKLNHSQKCNISNYINYKILIQ